MVVKSSQFITSSRVVPILLLAVTLIMSSFVRITSFTRPSLSSPYSPVVIRKALTSFTGSTFHTRNAREYVMESETLYKRLLQPTSRAHAKRLGMLQEGTEDKLVPDENLQMQEFEKLGLLSEIIRGLSAKGFVEPTPVQKKVIPRIINKENMLMAASTGSGKTLAFALPIIQSLKMQEHDGYTRAPRRPRALILVPTRELARQILSAIKDISHFAKVSSTCVLGGEPYAIQKKALDRFVDIVVASPGRLMQHKDQGNVYLSQVTHVIIDEVDTMLTQGFGSDIRGILRSVLGNKANIGVNQKETQIIMATATLTKAVRKLMADVDGFNIDYSDEDNQTPKKLTGKEDRVKMNIVEIDGVHRIQPNVQHNFEDTKGTDKLLTLNSVIERYARRDLRTLIFCNTVDSCRAVEHALKESLIDTLSYHGDLRGTDREDNLNKFRSGEFQYLVCTDIAARGIDIPEIEHVILFDFPLNPIDYIHRAGRTGRAGRVGIVTSLITKRDMVLSDAIQGAIARGLPIDSLSSSKRDYQDRAKFAEVIGRVAKGTPLKSERKKYWRKSPVPEKKDKVESGVAPNSNVKSKFSGSGSGKKGGTLNRKRR